MDSPVRFSDKRMEDEWRTVRTMIALYCRAHHGGGELCPVCRELADYAAMRLSRCRFAPDKPTCKRCPVHCYRPDKREQMRAVMRYAGPRMLLRHPMAALRHLLREVR